VQMTRLGMYGHLQPKLWIIPSSPGIRYQPAVKPESHTSSFTKSSYIQKVGLTVAWTQPTTPPHKISVQSQFNLWRITHFKISVGCAQAHNNRRGCQRQTILVLEYEIYLLSLSSVS
jgi:hypothetical protein